MLPLPGFVRRAIFAEYDPEVEHLDAIAWRTSPHALYVVSRGYTRKATPACHPAYPPAGSDCAQRSA